MEFSKVTFAILLTSAIVLSAVVGFLIGFFSHKKQIETVEVEVENPINEFYSSLIKEEDPSFNQKLIDEIDAKRIETHLRRMTNASHMAGTDGDKDSAEYVADTWKSQNLDYVKIIEYEVLLAKPDPNQPNSFTITNQDGTFNTTPIIEAYFDEEITYGYIPRPFLAYSMSGSYQSDKVFYVNYCELDDFIELVENRLQSINDSIVLCRYGRIFRGNKVKLAAQYGAKAVLIYEDPLRGAPAGQQVYPNGEFLPGDGMQRGSLFTGNGDPLTPLYPSTADAFRLDQSESSELPTIIAQVIGYHHAKMIFEMIQQHTVVPDGWGGALDIKYTLGGQLSDNKKLTVNVYNSRDKATTRNVVGVIKGEVEPDRYVLMGNHRDAWVLGAIDPTSGTASMLEISRSLMELKKNKGWKPKRSIVFLSWGAEEFGLIGSTEWVEEYQKKLSANGVAYLNIDIAVQGNHTYIAKSTPLLFDLIFDVTKTIKLDNSETVFDRWRRYAPNSDDPTIPKISSTLGSGSDYMGFQQRIGLACVDSTFTQDSNDDKYKLLGGSYPTYHSSFETFNLVKKFIDPEFKSFKAVATVVAELARRLSDSLILPFNCIEYGKDMDMLLKDLRTKYGTDLNAQSISLSGLENAINQYKKSAASFHSRLSKIDKTHANEIRQYNDQLKNLEKAFIDPSGISRNGFQHMLSAPSLINTYGGDGFPALADAIFNAKRNPTDSTWREVRRQLAIAIYVVNSASSVLDEPIKFERQY